MSNIDAIIAAIVAWDKECEAAERAAQEEQQ